jgi:3-oxoadipate enol-lactonase
MAWKYMTVNDHESWRGTIDIGACVVYVAIDGPNKAPPLMLSNSLGSDMTMWEPQMAAFSKYFRVIRYDSRGHGKSSAPQGPYTIERLGHDAIAVLDNLGIEKTNWCGLSMGGMVGQWLGAQAPSRVEKLILSNTTSYYSDKQSWTDRIEFVRANGIQAMAARSMERWFSPEFRERESIAVARASEMLVATNPDGYTASCAAVRDMDHRGLLSAIHTPTLVIAGLLDLAAPIQAHQFIRDHVPNAKLLVLNASHLSNIEQPKEYAGAVLQFLLNQ